MFWWMSKIAKVPKIIIMHQILLVKWNHRAVLLWCVVKMKHFYYKSYVARDTYTIGNWLVTSRSLKYEKPHAEYKVFMVKQ